MHSDGSLDDNEKLIRRHLVLGDWSFICCFLDIAMDTAIEACTTYGKLAAQYHDMVRDPDPNRAVRNAAEFGRIELQIVQSLQNEAQRHD